MMDKREQEELERIHHSMYSDTYNLKRIGRWSSCPATQEFCMAWHDILRPLMFQMASELQTLSLEHPPRKKVDAKARAEAHKCDREAILATLHMAKVRREQKQEVKKMLRQLSKDCCGDKETMV